MEQQIRFCTTRNGLGVAYATIGEGHALVIPPGWVSHLENDWEDPPLRALTERLARHHTVVRYDKPGTGLSDRERPEISLTSEMETLSAVTEQLKLDRFALIGASQGSPLAIAYAAVNPERVSHLILYAGYVRGTDLSTDAFKAPFLPMVRAHWGIASKTLADMFLPGESGEVVERMAQRQRRARSPEMAVRFMEYGYEVDVTNEARRVRVPTLVLHRKKERVIPFGNGRELASLIPDARFIPLEGNIHPPVPRRCRLGASAGLRVPGRPA